MLSDTVNVLEKDIEFGEQLWKTFESETFGEYHNIHLQSDVLVLADVFENFRELFKPLSLLLGAECFLGCNVKKHRSQYRALIGHRYTAVL